MRGKYQKYNQVKFKKIFYSIIKKNPFYKKIGKSVPVASCAQGVKLVDGSAIVNYQNDATKIIIGEKSLIEGSLIVNPYGGKIVIGKSSFIGAGAIIQSDTSIKIGNHVLISNNVRIVDNNAHETDFREREITKNQIIEHGFDSLNNRGNIEGKEIIIEDHVWISFNVIILKGVHIGEGAIVGAGSVVTKDVAPFTLVAGNPAQFKKKL